MDKTATSQEKVNDRCPSWATQLIARIRDVEIEQGNINPEGDWQQKDLTAVQSRVFGENEGEDDAEIIFADLAKRLTAEGFTAVEIAEFVNSRIRTGTRLAYCSAAEVSEALG